MGPYLRYRDAVTVENSPLAQIDPAEAVRLLGEGAVLLDVREDDEWDAGHAPDAVHVPMGQVADRAGELPTDRPVVCICRVGGRSGAVADALQGAGYDVRNVDGGMLAWEQAGLAVVAAGGAAGRVI